MGGFPALELGEVERHAAPRAVVARRMKLAPADLPTNPVGGAPAEVPAGGAAIECRARRGRDGVARRAQYLATEPRLEEPLQFRELLARELLDEHAEGGGGRRDCLCHSRRPARPRRHVQVSPD
jgi:hypothetical protein